MKLFKKMKEFAGNHIIGLSFFLSFFLSTLFVGIQETGAFVEFKYFRVAKGVLLFIIVFMGTFSLGTFEEMTKKYERGIDKLRAENEYLKQLLLERDKLDEEEK